MTQAEETQYVSVRATPDIVGRKGVLEQIREAIETESKTPTVFYITAWGGRGKTRLLDAVIRRYADGQNPGLWYSPKVFAARRLVDLYHLHTHNVDGLIHEMYDVLDPGAGQFDNYVFEHAELNRKKHDLSEILREVTQQREQMIDTFVEDFNKLRKDYRKVVLALDTAETLVYETDRVQEALGLADEPIGVAGWIVKEFLQKIQHAVVLIAGRPESPKLRDDLRGLGKKIKLIEIDLPDFEEDESIEYFEAVANAARGEDLKTAEQIEKIPDDTRKVIHMLTGGQPLLLSLILDYLIITDELVPEVRVSLDKANTMTKTKVDRKEVQTKLKAAVMKGIQEASRPLDEIVLASSWMPKGIGAVSLAWVLELGQPTEEEIDEAKQYIQWLRESEHRLSFVKIRPQDEMVFLQDEMYTLFEGIHKNYPSEKKDKIYQAVLGFYQYQIDRVSKGIEEMISADIEQTLSSPDPSQFTKVQRAKRAEEQEKLRQARTGLQSYQIEQVFYTLQVDPLKGFELYFEYAEEAFRNNKPGLWLPLRDELLKFTKKFKELGVDEIGGLKLADIESDIGIRWIKNNIVQGKYDIARNQASRFRETCADLLLPGSFSDMHLKIWEGHNLNYRGKDIYDAESFLIDVIPQIKTLPEETSFEKWRKNLLFAYAYSTLGYHYRARGQFHRAIPQYRQALPFWRELDIPAEHANTLNNLAWALAEMGDFKTALVHCKDGLNLRKKLGRRYTMALSYNTLGLIETRNDQPARARLRCQKALGIFRDLEQPRGVGLASHALAEALRRMTNVPELLAENDAFMTLQLAMEYADEAVVIFEDILQEPLRLAEAYIEQGCVCREYARRLPEGDPERTKMIKKGVKALSRSAETTGKEFRYRAVDALVNLAWLHYYIGDPKEAERILTDEVRGMIDDRYFFSRDHGAFEMDDAVPWFWVQLGKADLLLGQIHFDRYQELCREDNYTGAEDELRKAAHVWALSLAYNRRYGEDFRDLGRGLDDIYRNMSVLNIDEMDSMVKSVQQTYVEYHVDEKYRLFERFIRERFGY